jgi:hypothetical protein
MYGTRPETSVFRFSHYSTAFSNFSFQADVKKVQGNVNTPAGILFRSTGIFDNTYAFRLDTDGNYLIGKRAGGTAALIVPSTYSSAINKGLNVWNTLKVVCHGSMIQFYINDKVVNVIEDSSFSGGQVGVYALDESTATNVVHFDNVEVYSISVP